jgi:hypothetical protein
MLCIALFVLFLVLFPFLGFFKGYRVWFRKAWKCVWLKTTFRPCDQDLAEEVQQAVFSKLFFFSPKLAKSAKVAVPVLVYGFAFLTIWSTYSVIETGLNLYVYGTCNPSSGESCALSGGACGAGANKRPMIWQTVSRIPDRWQEWNASEFLPEIVSTYEPRDESKEYVLEAIDPMCEFCAKQYQALKEAKIDDEYNLTYLLYPIQLPNGEYRFQNSQLIARYVETLKEYPQKNRDQGADWLILREIFENSSIQTAIKTLYTQQEVDEWVADVLRKNDFNQEEILAIQQMQASDEITQRLLVQRNIVDQRISTIRIPTLIIEGKRFDSVVSSEKLRKMSQ